MRKIGKYEIVAAIGRGSAGTVYKARDPLIGRFVALKTFTTSASDQGNWFQRFQAEVRAAATLQHPHIVNIFDLGKDGDTLYIAMEHLEGKTLDQVIQARDALPLSRRAGLMIPVCQALDYAHKQGVLHRDLKPSNIIITKDGIVKVLDFGISPHTREFHAGTVLKGAMHYISPEQIRGEPDNEGTDIWAFGATFYKLLCYRPAFETVLNIAAPRARPLPVRELVPDCPPPLDALIEKLLEKDPQQRFHDMQEVLSELKSICTGLQEASIAALLVESEERIRWRDFSAARESLRQVLQMDNRSDRARSLLDDVNKEVKRNQVRAQTEELIAKAQTSLAEKHYTQAEIEVQSALALDPASAQSTELLAKIRSTAQRDQAIQHCLRTARQHLTTGSLTQALGEIHDALELDPENEQVRVLQKQVEDQLARREERRRLSELLQRARKLWADQHLDECISLLDGVPQEFLADSEVRKLLETAKQDRSEQEKHHRLSQVRALLAEQKVDEAFAIVEELSNQQPNDETIHKLYGLVFHEKESLLRKQELQRKREALQSLLASHKFDEAASQGEKLLREFPQEIELRELVSFARSEAEQIERQRLIDKTLKDLQMKISSGKIQQAIADAEQGLARFPESPALTELLKEAQTKLKDQVNRENLQRRIGEIRGKINAGEHTDAVDVARQTLTTFGPDDQVTQLLRAAEMELAQKKQKQKERDQRLGAAQTLLQEGRLDSATQILQGGLATRILSGNDPTVRELLDEIDSRQRASAGFGATRVRAPGERITSGGRENSYVFQPGSPITKEPSHDGAHSEASPIMETMPIVSMVASPQERPETPMEPDEPADVTLSKWIWLKDKSKTAAFLTLTAFRRHYQTVVEHASTIPRKRLWSLVCAALGIVVVIAGGFYLVHKATHDSLALRDHAQMLERRKNWPAALDEYKKLAERRGELAKEARERSSILRALIDQESSLVSSAQHSQADGDLPEAKRLYQQIAALHGDMETDAVHAIARLDAMIDATATPAQQEQGAFQEGEKRFSQHDWAGSKTCFETVVSLNLPDSAFVSKAKRYLATIQDREKEENLYRTALAQKQAGKWDEAIETLNKIIAMNGPLKANAQRDLAEATRLKGPPANLLSAIQDLVSQEKFSDARNKLGDLNEWTGEQEHVKKSIDEAELRFVAQAKSQIDSAIKTDDVSLVSGLKEKLLEISSGAGPAASEAQDLAINRLPATEKTINGRKEFSRAQADFNNAVAAQDSRAMKNLIPEFERLAASGESFAAAAQNYLDKFIPEATAKFPPTPDDDRKAIVDLLDRYLDAVNHRDFSALQTVWPTANKDPQHGYEKLFRESQSLQMSLKYDAKTIDLAANNTQATLKATFARSEAKANGTKESHGKETFRFSKQTGGAWVIESAR